MSFDMFAATDPSYSKFNHMPVTLNFDAKIHSYVSQNGHSAAKQKQLANKNFSS